MLGKNSDLYKAWQQDWKRYERMPAELTIANLGSTCDANNFDYSYWDMVGFNFASGPQDMYYDNQLLEQYGKRLRKGAVVFICLSEFAFLVDKYKMDYRNYKYYGYVEPGRILNYTPRKAAMIKHCPGLLYSKCLKQEIKGYIKKLLRYEQHKNRSAAPLKDSAKQMMRNWMREFGWENGVRVTAEQRETMARSWSLFMSDIEYCRENDLVPVVVIPPFVDHLKNEMPVGVLDECLWRYIAAIEEQGIRVISFWDDSELANEKYYRTPICLNEDGKKLFNCKLRSAVFGE